MSDDGRDGRALAKLAKVRNREFLRLFGRGTKINTHHHGELMGVAVECKAEEIGKSYIVLLPIPRGRAVLYIAAKELFIGLITCLLINCFNKLLSSVNKLEDVECVCV